MIQTICFVCVPCCMLSCHMMGWCCGQYGQLICQYVSLASWRGALRGVDSDSGRGRGLGCGHGCGRGDDSHVDTDVSGGVSGEGCGAILRGTVRMWMNVVIVGVKRDIVMER